MSADPASPQKGARDAMPGEAVAACADLVRRHDHDRYVAALFAAPDDRAALVALYAFNLELARVRETVSEPALGDIRLQWWRETLDGIRAGNPVRQHVVALALADAIGRGRLDCAGLGRLIDGRAFDLTDSQPATLDALEHYADATAGELGALAAAALGADERGRSAARAAGTAWGLSGLLRAVPFHAAQNRIYLPAGELPAGPSQQALLAGRPDPDIAQTVARVAARARSHLDAARDGVPRRVLPALLPAALIDRDLRRLERAGWNPFALRPEAPLLRTLRLVAAGLRGRI